MKTLIISILSLLLINAQAQITDTATVIDTLARTPSSVPTDAKNCWRHEFSIWGAGGISTLNYTPSFGNRTNLAGGAFGMGYTFYFHRNWGIHTGAEVAVYNTTFNLKNLKDSYTRYGFDDLTPSWTGTDEKIDYHTELRTYTEKQQLLNLNIPLMLQFQTPLQVGSRHQFFASAGAKFGIPLKSTYKVSNTTVYTWYYDYKSNQEFRPDPTDYGNPHLEDLGCFYNTPYSTEKLANKFEIAGLAMAEMGVKWRLNSKHSLYVGAYFDYGFTNINKQKDNRFFEFDPENAELVSYSILSSQYAHNGGAIKNFTQNVSPVSFGIKIRLGINNCKVEKRSNASTSFSDRKPPKFSDTERNQNVCAYCKCCRKCCSCKEQAEPEKTTGADLQPVPTAPTSLLEAEMQRATAEYGNLKDLFVLHVDGYEINQTKLSPTMEKMIDRKLHALQAYNNDNYTIIIEGHTCDLGAAGFNKWLARVRAEEVRDYLVKKGFKHSNLVVASKGKTTPIIENTSEARRKINRRVVFLVKENK
jgi:outer membrane protein OmpA-like peptidoglycan-associated protein